MRWIVAVVLLVAAGSSPDGDDVQDRIRSSAQMAGDALVKADYQAFANLVYPRLLELMGGPERLKEALRTGREQMRASGADIVGMAVENVSTPVDAGSEKHAVVKYTLQMAVTGGILYQDTYLLAVSQDDGSTWTFVDGAGLTPEKVKMLFPGFNGDLALPDKAEPRFVPK